MTHIPPCTLKLTSSIPVAAGLGSGAAVSVAIIRALSAFLGTPLDDVQVNKLAYNVEKAAEVIGEFHEVTHSYLRKDNFNVWFTIIAADNIRIEDILEQIRSCLSLDDSQVLNLPMKRLFKLDTRFNVLPKSQD